METLDTAISLVWLHFLTYHLMPRGRKNHQIIAIFCFCPWRESNPSCLCSKKVCHPLHLGLSVSTCKIHLINLHRFSINHNFDGCYFNAFFTFPGHCARWRRRSPWSRSEPRKSTSWPCPSGSWSRPEDGRTRSWCSRTSSPKKSKRPSLILIDKSRQSKIDTCTKCKKISRTIN